MNITDILNIMVEQKASDAYLNVGSPVFLKTEGLYQPFNDEPILSGVPHQFAYSLMNPNQIQEFEKHWEYDFVHQENDIGRFRINLFRQRNDIGMVIRYIPKIIPSFEDLGLPLILKDLVLQRSGLILIVGPTGSGKSTTLASMLNFRNLHFPGHILTVEDPIEFTILPQKSIITQREIGTDTHSYARALKNALREAPDVIMIGEITESQTMNQVLSYAQSGHLCLATMHANNSIQALKRIAALSDTTERDLTFADLAGCIQGIVSQRLIPGINGKRVVATEVLLRSPNICEDIEQRNWHELNKMIETQYSEGMMSFNQSLIKLVNDSYITKEEALKHSDSPTDLNLRMRLGDSHEDNIGLRFNSDASS